MEQLLTAKIDVTKAKEAEEKKDITNKMTTKVEGEASGQLGELMKELEASKKRQDLLLQKVRELQGTANAEPSASAAAADVDTLGLTSAQLNAGETNTAGSDNDPAADVWLEFTADVSKIPVAPASLAGMKESDRTQVSTLKAFCSAIPWGAPTPAVTFHVIGVHPSVAHGLVGSSMWEECWGEKHGRITTTHIIPYSLFSVLKYAVEQLKDAPDDKTTEEGRNRWTQAKSEAADRRVRGKPY